MKALVLRIHITIAGQQLKINLQERRRDSLMNYHNHNQQELTSNLCSPLSILKDFSKIHCNRALIVQGEIRQLNHRQLFQKQMENNNWINLQITSISKIIILIQTKELMPWVFKVKVQWYLRISQTHYSKEFQPLSHL